jgi:anti-sigma B factor antagonist
VVPVSVETKQRDGASVVALTGELDVATATSVEEALLGVEEDEPERIVLDLRELRFIDSTGLSLLINADRRGRKAGRQVTIVTGTGPPRRILETVGLDTRLDVVQDLPAAG